MAMQIRFYSHCFLALCFCTALFACSDEKEEPTHADLCKNGASVKCLVGSWKLDEISGDREVNGMLTLEDNMWYIFISTQISHEGTWELNEDSTITLDCQQEGPPDYKCPGNNLENLKIELENHGDILKIHGSPFFDYRKINKAVEKYVFVP